MRDIETVLTIHNAQVKFATRAKTVPALKLVFRRLNENFVYREAA